MIDDDPMCKACGAAASLADQERMLDRGSRCYACYRADMEYYNVLRNLTKSAMSKKLRTLT